ncbi:MAG: hypothetical protein RJQ09_20785 [Cyclobacteriaceae bacterium]
MESQKEKKNQRKGLYFSIGIHSALLILFFFLLAWKEPFPPIPEYGIELNFGIDARGSGNVQRQAPPAPQETEEPVEEVTENEVEEAVEEIEEIQETDPVEAPSETVPDEGFEDSTSPDVVEEILEEERPAEEPIEEEKQVVPEATMPKKNLTDNAPGGNNQGDDDNAVGDQGDPEGEPDARALYGTPGAGSGGAGLDMAGWAWDELPRPKDNSNEAGKIVYKITVDDEGIIIGLSLVTSTVSQEVEKIYRAEVEKLTFRKIDGSDAPNSSTGRITFIIKSN